MVGSPSESNLQGDAIRGAPGAELVRPEFVYCQAFGLFCFSRFVTSSRHILACGFSRTSWYERYDYAYAIEDGSRLGWERCLTLIIEPILSLILSEKLTVFGVRVVVDLLKSATNTEPPLVDARPETDFDSIETTHINP